MDELAPAPPHRNRLAEQKSPYLLQHAHNPVDWYPWGEEAFERARCEDKPIFLSVGYATCHWCHVMERESFESEEIAELLNTSFVNIKVDREERPDVDRVYMTFVQATSGRGGWPMSVWLTPELRPFVGGTYFPPQRRYNHPGFAEVIRQIALAWQEEREQIRANAEQILLKLRALAESKDTGVALDDTSVIYGGFKAFQRSYDARFGGFGEAPKFPRPATFNLLLRYFTRTGDEEAAAMTLHTLRQMGRGGIHDQLGGGFHRYSVDGIWHVPHFEKMLYDQAQLARSYLDAFQLSDDSNCAQLARGILDYVARDLTDADGGGFYSAEDADSAPLGGPPEDKREGAYYVWGYDEIEAALGEHSQLFALHYGLLPQGNAEDPHGELSGQNVLHVMRSCAETASELGLSPPDAEQQLAAARAQLLALRGERPRPLLDDKILCAWNGMMIGAFARGFKVLHERRYLERAERAARFVERELFDPGTAQLYRRYRAGERAIEAYLEDYVQLVDGLLELYEASFELRWLRWAEQLTERQIELFADRAGGGFFATSDHDPSVLLRLKDDYDGAEPSGNSVAACNLLRLAAMLDRPDWEQLAAGTLRLFAARMQGTPEIMPQMLVAYDMQRNPPAQIVIVGQRDEPGVEQLRRACGRGYAPNTVLLLADEAFNQAYGKRLPWLAAMQRLDNRPTAYLCRERTCQQPTTEADDLVRQLGPVRYDCEQPVSPR